MKKGFALSLLALLVVGTALGSWSHNLVVEVPFDFHVGNDAMPAGRYVIDSTAAAGSILTLDSGAPGNQVIISTTPAACSTTGKSELVFNRVGNTYFLAKVWNEASNTSRQLPVSDLQRELSRAGETELQQLALVIGR